MIDKTRLGEIQGARVTGQNGERIGRAGQVYVDDDSGEARWVVVTVGRMSGSDRIMPLEGAELTRGMLRVPYNRDEVRRAPQVRSGERLDEARERMLESHYALRAEPARVPGVVEGRGEPEPAPVGAPVSEPRADPSVAAEPTRTAPVVEEVAARPEAEDPVAAKDEVRPGPEGLDAPSEGEDADTLGAGVGLIPASDAHGAAGSRDDQGIVRTTTEKETGMSEQESSSGTGRDLEVAPRRLRKYLVEEEVELKVRVTLVHEELRVDTGESVVDGVRAGDLVEEGADEVTLYEERPVLRAERRVLGRVRLD